MGKKDDVNSLRTSREFIAYARRHDCEIIRGKGSHVKARNDKGFVVIPDHSGDLPTGTRRAIIKVFAAMGIAILALLAILSILF
jgi:predicted RNA binding protein YcfA (HicA-like mRNA interferase family)